MTQGTQKIQVILISQDEEFKSLMMKDSQFIDKKGLILAKNFEEADYFLKVTENVSVVIVDVPGLTSELVSFLNKNKKRSLCPRMIVILQQGSKESSIECFRHGASDYFERPVSNSELKHSVGRCMSDYLHDLESEEDLKRLYARVNLVEGKKEDKYWYVSRSFATQKVNEALLSLRKETLRGMTEEPCVLFLGENGSGVEGFARMVHMASHRSQGPWVVVNCVNLNQKRLESELFGHSHRTFFGSSAQLGAVEIAKGGTLFLDQVGELDFHLQSLLLQVLEQKRFRRIGEQHDREADIRLITAQHGDLFQKVLQGKFQEHLYRYLSQVRIEVPSLRERPEDFLSMARQFAEESFRTQRKTFCGFMPEAEQLLKSYSWPGNERELMTVLERAALLWDELKPLPAKCLNLNLLDEDVKADPLDGSSIQDFESFIKLKKKWIDTFEKEYIISVIGRNKGNVSLAAREANMDRSNFLRLLRRHQMKASDFRQKRAA